MTNFKQDAVHSTTTPAVGPSAGASVEQRLDFMQLTKSDRDGIRSLKALIDRELPKGLDKFYAQLRETPRCAASSPPTSTSAAPRARR